MGKQTNRKRKPNATKPSTADIYADVTARIIEALEQGAAPWQRPWSVHGPSAMPRNANGRHYSGINVLLLWCEAQRQGYADPRWMTFKQAKSLGGQVRRGERSTRVVLWRQITVAADDKQDEDATKTIPVIRTFNVFNAGQVDGLDAAPVEVLDAGRAATVIEGSGADIRHGGGRAFYAVDGDYIRLPNRGDFVSAESYSSTALHELVHWSGAPHRLDRDLTGRFGDAKYAMEELVAELGAAFLGARLGVQGEHHGHVSYLSSWLEVLKRDSRAIVTAASAARKAADHLMGLAEGG